jgi:hypothetical protein
MPMFRTILLLDGARRTALLDLKEHLHRCAAESGITDGLMTVHALDSDFRLAVAETRAAAAPSRVSLIPFLALSPSLATPMRDALLLDLNGGALRFPGAVLLVNLDAADRPGRLLVRIGAPSETSGPEPASWERVFTRARVAQ